VPKVVGLFVGKAKKLIEAAGLKVGAIHHGSNDDRDEGVVLKQAPAEGTPAAPGSAIDLVVNE
jgi:beta-lactam-binding protein with PASTA domain